MAHTGGRGTVVHTEHHGGEDEGALARRRRRARVVQAIAAVVAVAAMVAGAAAWWSQSRRDQQRYPRFGSGDVYRLDVSMAPIDPRSDAMVENLVGQITPHWGGVAAFNAYRYNVAYFRADADTPRVRVGFTDCQKKGAPAKELYDGPAYFVDVPIPAEAQVTEGTDATMSIWSPDTDQLWEFWVMSQRAGQWSACWGGRIDDVSQNPGQFPVPFGVSASGLTMVGPMITVDEARQGRIEHAMSLGILSPAIASRVRYPATRSDGSDPSENALPEGTRLRLDPSIDVDSLRLTPLAAAVARAAQTYGFIVVDRAGAVSVGAEDGRARHRSEGADPWAAVMGSVPDYAQLKNFPWRQLQVVDAAFGSP